MAEYLRSYAARFELRVRLRWRVDKLSREADGCYVVSSAGRVLRADTVVVATGPGDAASAARRRRPAQTEHTVAALRRLPQPLPEM